jgi:hypothetical protein
LVLAQGYVDEKLSEGVIRRLRPLKTHNFDEAKSLLSELNDQAQKLHEAIKEHYVLEFEQWIGREKLHPLQMIVLQKHLAQLKDAP